MYYTTFTEQFRYLNEGFYKVKKNYFEVDYNMTETFNYKIQAGRRIIQRNNIEAEGIEDAYNKLKVEYGDYIIWVNGVRFPPAVTLHNYGFKLSQEVKDHFDRLRGVKLTNAFVKELLEFYEENNMKRR